MADGSIVAMVGTGHLIMDQKVLAASLYVMPVTIWISGADHQIDNPGVSSSILFA